ncbi:PREDICTED: minor histocompatibility protein HA-1 isoform X2 [Nanorana parkeri]|uniref:minor histocompatibility protein HA-1 isoform X2 n=1 Tax=Nanorana parkeri TaxID=125878 RepID=UPI00085439CA|nr:PREDICTED: minor histocompatibility protein HA-1 isoform X2 [Nanorana parkeri]
MFSRKKRELMKTPSLSKKSRAGSPAPQSELPRKDPNEPFTEIIPNPLPSSSPVSTGTLKRPTSLSRHASAAGIPLTSSRVKTVKPSGVPSPPESGEGPFIDVEDISQLLGDVARFAERLEKLRDVVLTDEVKETRRPLAHECLGEALRLLRQVINKYPLLNTVETLTAAGTLISKVKGFHYEASIENEKRDFEKALESMAVCFSSTISEFLMGEVDSSTLLSLPLGDQSQSMESLYGSLSGAESTLASAEYVDSGSPFGDDVDIILQKSEGGVRAAFSYAKKLAKYMKDLTSYIEKRTILEMEYAKGLQKLVNTTKGAITQEPYLPFQSIYSVALEQDQEHAHGVLHTSLTLQQQTYMQPVNMRRLEHEKRRKELKEQWQRAQRKLMEAEVNLRKSKQTYMQRSEEHEKALYYAARAEEEQSHIGTKSVDKKRRAEEEAKNKAEEAMATYRTCIADAKTQKQELEDVKVNVLRHLQELIKQTDQILRSATISYYQSMHKETAPLPVGFQTLCESSKLYDLGQQYASYVRQLGADVERETSYDFQPYTPQITLSPYIRTRKSSLSSQDFPATENKEPTAEEKVVERRDFPEKLIQPLTPTEDNENKKLTSLEQGINGLPAALEASLPTGPFRNVGLSRAARTHKLRKLRTPSKCRECNSYVYFQGAECEECSLACHKKCLETLAIQCGHKKLQGRLLLFGRNFSEAAQRSPDGVPFLIHKCVSEIEARALIMKGIYRVNGVKTRVEKLCQAFENGKELVELSQASPHDLSNVLKLYLRQLPEPIMPFRLYNGLMGLAKESLRGYETGKPSRLENKGPDTEPEVQAMVEKLKALLLELPHENKATLQYLIKHLCRVSELEQQNKMSPSNIGIVFGPALMRPRPTEATVSLSSLVDYPHQARIIEALIVFYDIIFEEPPLDLDKVSKNSDDTSSEGAVARLQVTTEEEESSVAREYRNTTFRESVGSVDSDSESDGGEDLPRQWETNAQLSKEVGETGTDDIPFIGTDVQSESEEDNAKSQDLAGSNTNQSNNVLMTAQVMRTPLHCHRHLPIIRLLQGRTTLSSSSGRYPQFV